MMERKVLSSRQYFKFLSLLYGLMLITQVGISTVMFFLRTTQSSALQNENLLDEFFQYLVPSVAFIMPTLGWFFYKKSLQNIGKSESLSEKLSKYQSSLLLKYAFFEGPSIFASVAYFLTGNILLLGVCVLLILLFLTQNPTKNKLFNEIALSPLEESQLNNPEAEVIETLVKD
ncbi:MAG: hypothetical protein R2822_13490 [Spirosomataceae bacterium]